MSTKAQSTDVNGTRLNSNKDIVGISAIEIGVTDRISWDGVMLFGNSRMDEFRAYLKKARETQSEPAYAMNFGMARIDGDKDEFEEMAVEYAVHTGKSPPNWLSSHTAKEKKTEQVAVIRVKSLTSETIIETTINLESPWPSVIDLADVTKVDPTGLELYNDCLNERISRNDKTKIINGEGLVKVFEQRLKTAKITESNSYWQFVFTYYKITGEKDKFDVAMSEFAMKGGTPVAWTDAQWKENRDVESQLVSGFTAGKALSQVNAGFADRLIREGIVAEAIKKGDPILVDFSSMDEGNIRDSTSVNDFVKKLHDEKVKMHFVNVNEIISAMLHIIGINKFVRITTPGALV